MTEPATPEPQEPRHLRAVDTPPDGVPVWGTPDPQDAAAETASPEVEEGAQGSEDGEASATPSALPVAKPATTDVRVLPTWATSREAFTGLVRERVTHGARLAAFHTIRSPRYWFRSLPRSVWTVGRVIRWLYRFSFDAEGKQLRRELSHAAGAGRAEVVAFHAATQQHRGVVRDRLLLMAVLGALVAAAGAVLWWWLPPVPLAVQVLAGVAAVPCLAAFSRDPEKPLTDAIRYAGNVVPPMSAELVAAALSSLGISQLTRGVKESGLQLISPIHRDGPGWRADIDLPSVPAGDVIERRDKLAAGLRRPLSVVWPSADPDSHEARLILWVGDKAPNKAKPRPWTLEKAGKVDLFDAFPVGRSPQGKPVGLTLMFASMVIGAVPRMGKTFALRLILLACALDVRAELHVFDLKGGADYRCLGPVAHRFRIGDEPEDIAYLAADTAELRTEMRRRYKVLRELPEKICPEGKVTQALADRKALRLHPIVLAIDETQFGFEHPEYGKQLEEDITDLVKRGPAAGITVILATQRPDAKSIPSGISGNAVIRYCLKVMKHDANDMVLGSGMHKAGIRATMFARSDRGTGYLVGEGDDPQIVTFGFVDGVTAKAIVARARAAREAAGTVTGYAADLDLAVEPEDDAPTLLDDLLAVMPADEAREWSEVLLERLADLRPATYGGWSTTDLGNGVQAYGLSTTQVNKRVAGKVVNRRGIVRADVLTAITERDAQREA